ncbi:MAG: PEP/pyruvate-binding domain-containing protein [Usitatibacter sp.]
MPDSPPLPQPRCSEPFLIGCGVAAADARPSPATLGFKAYNLWRMDRVGLPVPPAFVLGTDHCRYFLAHGAAPAGMRDLLFARIHELERATGLAFGSTRRPLCVSVRSGAAISMPGMMETILNVGLNGSTVRGLLRLAGNPRLAWDSYRRLVQSFAEVVHHCPAERFARVQARRVRQAGVESVRELDFQSLKALTEDFLELFEDHVGAPFPQNPFDQLEAAVTSIWQSWGAAKAVAYRKLNGVPDDLGTAVTVQRMVYGNAGGTSGAGVAFTRDPASGEPRLYLDFLFNAQGEDVVSGRHGAPDGARLAGILPSLKEDLDRVALQLEREFRDMQELEFTVQDGRLFILQTRTGKRSPWAELKIALDQVDEGLIDKAAAVERLAHVDAAKLCRARLAPSPDSRVLCRAVVANIGVAVGEIFFDPAKAAAAAALGRRVILVRASPATEDIAGIASAVGILTATGGRTSHAAVVARQLDKVCLVGCEALAVQADGRCTIAGETFREGDVLSLDGHTGDVIAGAVQVEIERPVADLERLARWRRETS